LWALNGRGKLFVGVKKGVANLVVGVKVGVANFILGPSKGIDENNTFQLI